MSTDIVTPPAETASRPAQRDGRPTLPRLLRSEWIKFRSLRSTWYTLAGAVAALLVIGIIIADNTGRHPAGLDPEDAVASAPLQGYHLAQLLIGVLGVLFVSGEYATGMIRSTLAAAPRRIPVLVAKAVVFGSMALVTMVPTALLTFLSSQAVLSHYGRGYSLTDPTALRVTLGTGVYLTLVGLLGSALGWIIRRTAGAISALVALLLIVPALIGLLGHWGRDVARYLPNSGESFIQSLRGDNTLGPWTGLGVLAAWVAAALVIAAVELRCRDV